MLNLKLNSKRLLILSIFMLTAFEAKAENTVGRYFFANTRNNLGRPGVDNVSHSVESNERSSFVHTDTNLHQVFKLKNILRTVRDAMNYGDFNKDYRQIIGFEHDYRRVKGGSRVYSHRNNSGTFFAMGDAKVTENLRLGGGLTFTRFDTDYSNSLAQYSENDVQAIIYSLYRNSGWTMRNTVFAGYGNSDVKRRALNNSNQITELSSNFNSFYYGTANTLTKTVEKDMFFFQAQTEFNGWGVRRDSFREEGDFNNALYLRSNDSMSWESVFEVFAGIKENNWSIKAGPSLSYIYSHAGDSFYATKTSGDRIYYSARKGERDYITWKGYLSYKFDNGVGVGGDIRYHNTDDPSWSFMAGINYRF